tara:strand:- start:3814 stop:5241 length:1428 start_codon:yes stop_codon:yes gene_type:complete
MKQELNYKELGFKSGMEIHQQLDGKKLFCNCETVIRDDKPDYTFQRELRAVVGETGKIDTAAKYEQKRKKYHVYEAYHDTNCLIEMDEEPPKQVNKKSLEIALKIALLFNAKIVDEVQVMRKTVVDGSNVSGFQRTALIALNGYIDTSKGRVGIPVILLEEEAAKRIKDHEDFTLWNISRLGIPLIEITTDPDIKDPLHAQEVAQKIGMICRSVEGVKRGLGTIRQDLNVSIKGHPRVEVKGFQDIRSIPKAVENEVKRQQEEIKSGKETHSHVRNVKKDFSSAYLRPMPGGARMYPETDLPTYKLDASNLELPELIDDISDKLEKKHKLGKDLAKALTKAKKHTLFEELAEKLDNIKPAFIGEVLVSLPKMLSKKHNKEIKPTKDDFKTLFKALNDGKISKDSVETILVEAKPVKDIIKNYFLMSDKDLEIEVKTIIDSNKGLPFNAMIGKVMAKLKGKADGKKIVEVVRKHCS